jgi:hypothetical protein
MSNEKFIQELKNYVDKMLHDDIFKTDDEQLIQDLKFWEDLIKEGKLDDMEYVNKW